MLYQLLSFAYRLARVLIASSMEDDSDSPEDHMFASVREYGKYTNRKFILTTDDDLPVVCIRQPYKGRKARVNTRWTSVYDSLDEDVTDFVMLFAGKRKDFMCTDLAPNDFMYYETHLRFASTDGEWIVPYDVPILSILA